MAAAHALAQSLPNATLTILNGAGHVPTMTRPQAVTQAIIGFLDTLTVDSANWG